MADDSSSYKANKGGEIASPQTESIVNSLKEVHGGKGSTSVRHNEHYGSFAKGSSTINTPATDSIVKGK